MSRETFVYRPNHPLADKFGCVPKHLVRSEYKPALYVISDNMEPLKHPGTGRMIDSKSEFRKDTRASGCLEVGTDPAAAREQPRFEVKTSDIVQDVKRAIQELQSR